MSDSSAVLMIDIVDPGNWYAITSYRLSFTVAVKAVEPFNICPVIRQSSASNIRRV